jgi:hypothetical protein
MAAAASSSTLQAIQRRADAMVAGFGELKLDLRFMKRDEV